MEIDEKNLKKLSKLLSAMDESSFTTEQFLAEFQKVMQVFLAMKQANEIKMKELVDNYEKIVSETKDITSDELAITKQTAMDYCKEEMSKMYSEHSASMNLLRDKLRELKDGKDADETKIVADVLAQIQLPEQKEILLDTPVQVRDKLETLQGDERLDKSAIKGLIEELDELKKQKQQLGASSIHAAGVRYFAGSGVTITGNVISTSATSVGYQVATGAVNGTNKDFVFASAPNVIVVDGLTLRKTQADGNANWTGTTTISLIVAPNYECYGVA